MFFRESQVKLKGVLKKPSRSTPACRFGSPQSLISGGIITPGFQEIAKAPLSGILRTSFRTPETPLQQFLKHDFKVKQKSKVIFALLSKEGPLAKNRYTNRHKKSKLTFEKKPTFCWLLDYRCFLLQDKSFFISIFLSSQANLSMTCRYKMQIIQFLGKTLWLDRVATERR
jgi:uncharacterized protein VirK/YbjX